MREMTDLEFLKAVRHRIRVPQLWCRGVYRAGNRVCLERAAGDFTTAALECAGSRLAALLGFRGSTGWTAAEQMINFNDFSTHAEVIAKLDEAIQRLEFAS